METDINVLNTLTEIKSELVQLNQYFTEKNKGLQIMGVQKVSLNNKVQNFQLNPNYYYTVDIYVDWASTPSSDATVTVQMVTGNVGQVPLSAPLNGTILRLRLEGPQINQISINNPNAINGIFYVSYSGFDAPQAFKLELLTS